MATNNTFNFDVHSEHDKVKVEVNLYVTLLQIKIKKGKVFEISKTFFIADDDATSQIGTFILQNLWLEHASQVRDYIQSITNLKFQP